MNWVLSDDRWCQVARDSDDLQAPLFVRTSVGVRRKSALAFCRQAAWRQGAVVRLRRGGLVEALELAQLRLLIRYLRRVRVRRHRLSHCLQWLRVWCYRRPEVPVELEWRSRTTRHDKTCCLGPSVSFFAVDTPVKTQCCGSHPCGPTVDRHSSVSSGVRYA